MGFPTGALPAVELLKLLWSIQGKYVLLFQQPQQGCCRPLRWEQPTPLRASQMVPDGIFLAGTLFSTGIEVMANPSRHQQGGEGSVWSHCVLFGPFGTLQARAGQREHKATPYLGIFIYS